MEEVLQQVELLDCMAVAQPSLFQAQLRGFVGGIVLVEGAVLLWKAVPRPCPDRSCLCVYHSVCHLTLALLCFSLSLENSFLPRDVCSRRTHTHTHTHTVVFISGYLYLIFSICNLFTQLCHFFLLPHLDIVFSLKKNLIAGV